MQAAVTTQLCHHTTVCNIVSHTLGWDRQVLLIVMHDGCLTSGRADKAIHRRCIGALPHMPLQTPSPTMLEHALTWWDFDRFKHRPWHHAGDQRDVHYVVCRRAYRVHVMAQGKRMMSCQNMPTTSALHCSTSVAEPAPRDEIHKLLDADFQQQIIV